MTSHGEYEEINLYMHIFLKELIKKISNIFLMFKIEGSRSQSDVVPPRPDSFVIFSIFFMSIASLLIVLST
jgi:hypothetical protein